MIHTESWLISFKSVACLVPIPGIILTIMLPPLLCFWPIFYWFFSIIYPVECNLTITQFSFFFMIVLKTLFTISPVCVLSFAAISFDLGWLSPSETTVDLKTPGDRGMYHFLKNLAYIATPAILLLSFAASIVFVSIFTEYLVRHVFEI